MIIQCLTPFSCPAVTSLPSCDKIYVLEYGYITIPMFSLNAFVLIAILTYAAMRAQKEVTGK